MKSPLRTSRFVLVLFLLILLEQQELDAWKSLQGVNGLSNSVMTLRGGGKGDSWTRIEDLVIDEEDRKAFLNEVQGEGPVSRDVALRNERLIKSIIRNVPAGSMEKKKKKKKKTVNTAAGTDWYERKLRSARAQYHKWTSEGIRLPTAEEIGKQYIENSLSTFKRRMEKFTGNENLKRKVIMTAISKRYEYCGDVLLKRGSQLRAYQFYLNATKYDRTNFRALKMVEKFSSQIRRPLKKQISNRPEKHIKASLQDHFNLKDLSTIPYSSIKIHAVLDYFRIAAGQLLKFFFTSKQPADVKFLGFFAITNAESPPVHSGGSRRSPTVRSEPGPNVSGWMMVRSSSVLGPVI
eukprot:768382-Hanusia_phi.AAC.11